MDSPDRKICIDATMTSNRSDTLHRATLGSLCGDGTHRALANIGCVMEGHTATLSGEAATFYLKQLAQETAARLDGVKRVKNEITVRVTTQNERSF